ncbi:diguanylate cyclase [bacterium]|nr:diguanylate cyclase [bacterium]
MKRSWIDRTRSQPERSRIMVFEPDDTIRAELCQALQEDPLSDIDPIESVDAARLVLAEKKFNLVIAPTKPEGMTDNQFVRLVNEFSPGIPVLLTGSPDKSSRRHMLEAGADDILYKPIEEKEVLYRAARALQLYRLRQASEELRRQNKELWGRAITDRLTGLYNRQYFEEVLSGEFERAKRYRTQVSCIMFDIDHFKMINDRYGHLTGDTVLRELGKLVVDTLRRADIAARYGGEEFVVILPETTRSGAKLVAERLREYTEAFQFCAQSPPENGPMRTITISLGVAHYPDDRVSTSQQLLKMADEMLYIAKRAGRNRVVVAWERPEE